MSQEKGLATLRREDDQQSGDAGWSPQRMKEWENNKPGRVQLLTGITMTESAKSAPRKSLQPFMKDLNIFHLSTISLSKLESLN